VAAYPTYPFRVIKSRIKFNFNAFGITMNEGGAIGGFFQNPERSNLNPLERNKKNLANWLPGGKDI
jgi:hypothetical protein